MTARMRVLLVDDHALFREGLASLLSSQDDIQIVGEAGDGLEALVMAQELQPDVVLMDVTMPGCDGLEATQQIKAALPEAKIVMLTVHDDDERLFEAIRSGAVGYLLKTTASETLLPMLHGAMRGEAAISRTMAARIMEEFARLSRQMPSGAQHKDGPTLTLREKQVLKLVAAGAMDKEISHELTISLSTVKTHIRSILAKLHATSRYQAVDYALRKGLIYTEGQKHSHNHQVHDPL